MSAFQPDFERPMGAERATLMLPLHVVMAARIRGHIDLEQMRSTVEELRSRHTLGEQTNEQLCLSKVEAVEEL